jgi:hypothetical protein
MDEADHRPSRTAMAGFFRALPYSESCALRVSEAYLVDTQRLLNGIKLEFESVHDYRMQRTLHISGVSRSPEERLAALRRANDARYLPPSALLPNLGIVDRKRVIHRGYLLPRDICDDF